MHGHDEHLLQIEEPTEPEGQHFIIENVEEDVKPTSAIKVEHFEAEAEYQIEALDEELLLELSADKPVPKTRSQVWPCSICNINFRTRSLQRNHAREHNKTDERKPKARKMCQLCGLSFATNGWYHHVSPPATNLHNPLQHLQISFQILRAHTENVRFVCDFCGKGYRVKHDLKDHIQTHMDVESRKKFPCAHCSTSLLSKSALKNHEHIFHSNVIEEHPCECGKVFASRMKLYQHRTTVHNKGHYPCPTCTKAYTVKSALQKHIVKNHRKKVPCEVCNKLVAPGMFMNRHLKSHLPPMYKCSFDNCLKEFQSRSALVYHEESRHKTLEVVSCPTCNASCTSARNLKRHIARQHSSFRVQCEVNGCCHTATRKDYLASHYRSHKDIDDKTREILLAKVKQIKVISW